MDFPRVQVYARAVRRTAWGLVLGLALSIASFAQGQTPRLVVPVGHSRAIDRLSVSLNGTRILSAGSDGFVKVWDIASGRSIWSRFGNDIDDACLSSDGSIAVIAESQQGLIGKPELLAIELRTGATLWRRPTVVPIHLLCSPDGKSLIVASPEAPNRIAQILDVRTGSPLGELSVGTTTKVPYSLACSPDGRWIAIGDTRDLWLFNAKTRALVRTWPGLPLGNHLEFDSAGTALSGGTGPAAILLDVATGKVLRTLAQGEEAPPFIQTIALPGGKWMTSSSASLTVWQASGEPSITRYDSISIHCIALAPGGQSFYLTAGSRIYEIGLDGRTLLRSFEDRTRISGAIVRRPDSDRVITAGIDIQEWDLGSGDRIFRNPDQAAVQVAAVAPDKDLLLQILEDGLSLDSLARSGMKPISYMKGVAGFAENTMAARLVDGKVRVVVAWKDHLSLLEDGVEIRKIPSNVSNLGQGAVALSPDGKIVYASGDGLCQIYDWASGELRLSKFDAHFGFSSAFALSPDGRSIARDASGSVTVFSATTLEPSTTVFAGASVRYVDFSPDSKLLAVCAGPNLVVTPVSQPILTKRKVMDAKCEASAFSKDGSRIYASLADGSIAILRTSDLGELVRLVLLDDGNWAVVAPSGLFDASPGAMRKLYWVVGDEIIDLDQVKTRNWVPGLLKKVLKGETLPAGEGFPVDKMFPLARVEAPPTGSTVATVYLTRRSGGIGQIKVYVNGAPVPVKIDASALARAPSPQVKVDLAGYFIPGRKNDIQVIVSNADGGLVGRSGSAGWEPPAKGVVAQPKMFVLAVGTGAYGGSLNPLRLPPKDAADFISAMRIAGKAMFGDKLDMTLLTTDPGLLADGTGVKVGDATKQAIAAAFARIQQEASPSDAVVVFMAGHGVTFTRGSEAVYCYLTREAASGDVSDADVRRARAVSMDELSEWMVPSADGKHGIRAQRRVLILDTCASGAAVSNLMVGARDADPDRVKALELFKDRTGFWILAGSAGNASSYEAGMFGQGLLTYSLLEGMQGPALVGDTLDVRRLFEFAQLQTQRLASTQLGVDQEPQLFAANQSFPIGILGPSARSGIKLSQPKRRILRPRDFQNRDLDYDSIGLTAKVRSALGSASPRSASGSVWYVDGESTELPDAVLPVGSYTVVDGRVKVTLRLVQNGKPIDSTILEGSEKDVPSLAELIAAKIEEMAAKLGPP